MLLRIALLAILMVSVTWAQDGSASIPKVFGGGDVDEVLWVRLDKGDLMLESIMKIIDSHQIHDGAVLSAVGGLESCKFHGVGGTMTTVTEHVELLSLGGLVADGKPHLHIIVSNKARGAFGGHLEEGCKVLSQVEMSIAKFSGKPMARKRGPDGRTALQTK